MIRNVLLAIILATGVQASPFDVGGPFALVDQTGEVRTEQDPEGDFQLLFFGYANCEQICSAALPLMAMIVNDVADTGVVKPVMITVDPARDTLEVMQNALAIHHPDFVGLTGDRDSLQQAYDAFSIETEYLFTDIAQGEVYAHGSFMYLLNGEGEVLTVLPPVLNPDRAAEIIRGYLTEST